MINPTDIPPIPPEIPYRNAIHTHFYIDGNIRSSELLRMFRRRSTLKYQESPKVPKREVFPMVQLPPIIHNTQRPPLSYPLKYPKKFVMWDISPQFDLYERTIVIRDTNGTWRTAHWEERCAVQDFRSKLRYPLKIPYQHSIRR